MSKKLFSKALNAVFVLALGGVLLEFSLIDSVQAMDAPEDEYNKPFMIFKSSSNKIFPLERDTSELHQSTPWVWVQFINLKYLEKYKIFPDCILYLIHLTSLEALQQEQNVSSYGANFREFVFQHSLEADNCDQIDLLIDRVFASIVKAISTRISQTPGKNWFEWIKEGSLIGKGNTPENAFVNLKLSYFNMDQSEWLGSVQSMRAKLLTFSEDYHIAWVEILEACRRYSRNTALMAVWLQDKDLPLQYAEVIAKYGHLLTLGDYLAPRAPSFKAIVEDLEHSSLWKSLLVLDLRGLGVTNRQAQDTWVEKGAPFNELQNISYVGEAHDSAQNVLTALPSSIFYARCMIADNIIVGFKVKKDPIIDALLQKIIQLDCFHLGFASRGEGETLGNTLSRICAILRSPSVVYVEDSGLMQ